MVDPSLAVCVIGFQESSMRALCEASVCLKTEQRDFSAKSNKAECAIKQPVKEVIGTKHIEHQPNFAHNSILHAMCACWKCIEMKSAKSFLSVFFSVMFFVLLFSVLVFSLNFLFCLVWSGSYKPKYISAIKKNWFVWI